MKRPPLNGLLQVLGESLRTASIYLITARLAGVCRDWSVQDVSRAQYADDADENPKAVQREVGAVALERGAPCEHDGVYGVENPDEHEGTLRPKPTDEAKTENPHQDASHFNYFNVAQDK
jgi:hypothetical protein